MKYIPLPNYFGHRNENFEQNEGHQAAIFIVPDGLPEKYFVEQMYKRCIISNLKNRRKAIFFWKQLFRFV